MELDQFKNEWNAPEQSGFTPASASLEAILKNKTYGPAAALRERFSRQLWLVPAFAAVMLYKFWANPALLHNTAVWFFTAVGLLLGVFFAWNLYVLNRIQHPGEALKQAVEKDLRQLEQHFRIFHIGYRFILMAFAVLLEWMMHHQLFPELQDWYEVALGWRVAAYAGIIVLTWFQARYIYRKYYGRHIDYLKELAARMQ